MAVTIREIAKKVGVAPSTVSAALSPVCEKKISTKRINQIKNVAQQMGYQPNWSARHLRTGKTFNIGVVVPSFLQHYPIFKYFDLLTNISRKHGYHVIPIELHRAAGEFSKHLKELGPNQIDGIIFLDYYKESYDEYLNYWSSNTPMVFRVLDDIYANLPFDLVIVNHYSAAAELFNHLIKSGWQDILITAEEGFNTVNIKGSGGAYRAWKEYLIRSGIKNVNDVIINKHGRDGKSNYDAIKNAIAAGRIFKGKTCLVLDGGDGVSGVYEALRQAELKIGVDVGVACFHSIPDNEFVYPEPTCLKEPFGKVSETLVRNLLQLIASKDTGFLVEKNMFIPKLSVTSTTNFKNVNKEK